MAAESTPKMSTDEAADALRTYVHRFVTPLMHAMDALTTLQEQEHQRAQLTQDVATLTAEKERLATDNAAAEQAHAEKLAQMDVDAAQARDAETEHAMKVLEGMRQEISTLAQRKVLAEKQADEAEAQSTQRIADAQQRQAAAEEAARAIEATLAQLKERHKL